MARTQIIWQYGAYGNLFGFVSGEPRFEIDSFQAGGWKWAVLYKFPRTQWFEKFTNIRSAKAAAKKILACPYASL